MPTHNLGGGHRKWKKTIPKKHLPVQWNKSLTVGRGASPPPGKSGNRVISGKFCIWDFNSCLTTFTFANLFLYSWKNDKTTNISTVLVLLKEWQDNQYINSSCVSQCVREFGLNRSLQFKLQLNEWKLSTRTITSSYLYIVGFTNMNKFQNNCQFTVALWSIFIWKYNFYFINCWFVLYQKNCFTKI